MEASTKVDLKVCGVCGDKALGYNFNAVTCESCKAFFRRNALAKKDFRCPFDEQCVITQVTRRFCQKCRLDKCFSIGMRKEYIMSEQDKVAKRQKIEENRARKRSNSNQFKQGFKKIKREHGDVYLDDELSRESYDIHDGYNNSNNGSYAPDSLNLNGKSPSINSDFSPESIIDKSVNSPSEDVMIRNMLNTTPSGSSIKSDEEIENSISSSTNTGNNNNETQCNNNIDSANLRSLNKNSYIQEEVRNPVDTTRDILEDVQRIPIEANSIESILCEAIKLEFEAYSSLGPSHNNSRELNDAERAKLNELIVANKALMTPVDEDVSQMIAEDCRLKSTDHSLLSDPGMVDVINLTAVAIRRLIKMAKKINAFKNMCQEDQVALLKGGCTEMMLLRSAMNYDVTKQTWRIPHINESFSTLNVDVLKKAKGNIYQEHNRFMMSFDQRWRADENIVLILCAITLFTPDRPRVVHQDVIKLEQNSYYYLLRRYLESVYPGCEAKSTFLKLIQKIAELHKVNEEVINCYLDVNPSHVEPLLIEIFDLKHQ